MVHFSSGLSNRCSIECWQTLPTWSDTMRHAVLACWALWRHATEVIRWTRSLSDPLERAYATLGVADILLPETGEPGAVS